MKKYLLTLLIVAISVTAFAQDTTFGIRGGINISNLDIEPNPTIENSHRNGYFFGGFVNWRLDDKSALHTELQFSQEGGKNEALQADYIQVPVMLEFELGHSLTAGLGGMASVKTWSYEDGFETFTYSGIAGLEFLINDTLFIEARFNYGLTNIFDDKSLNEATNTSLQLGIGIKI